MQNRPCNEPPHPNANANILLHDPAKQSKPDMITLIYFWLSAVMPISSVSLAVGPIRPMCGRSH